MVRRRYISPDLSLASVGERELASIDPSSPHFCPLSAFRDRTFILPFFSAFVRHEQDFSIHILSPVLPVP